VAFVVSGWRDLGTHFEIAPRVNAGADLDYMLRRPIGLGIGVAGFSRTNAPPGDAGSATAGGVHLGGAGRLRF
jgi:hypothetical protein